MRFTFDALGNLIIKNEKLFRFTAKPIRAGHAPVPHQGIRGGIQPQPGQKIITDNLKKKGEDSFLQTNVFFLFVKFHHKLN